MEVLPSSNTLSGWIPPASQVSSKERSFHCSSSFHRVRVVTIARGPQRVESLLFYGRVDRLTWDPQRWRWPCPQGAVPLLNYSTKLGRELLQTKHVIPDVVTNKWQGILLASQRLRLKTV